MQFGESAYRPSTHVGSRAALTVRPQLKQLDAKLVESSDAQGAHLEILEAVSVGARYCVMRGQGM